MGRRLVAREADRCYTCGSPLEKRGRSRQARLRFPTSCVPHSHLLWDIMPTPHDIADYKAGKEFAHRAGEDTPVLMKNLEGHWDRFFENTFRHMYPGNIEKTDETEQKNLWCAQVVREEQEIYERLHSKSDWHYKVLAAALRKYKNRKSARLSRSKKTGGLAHLQVVNKELSSARDQVVRLIHSTGDHALFERTTSIYFAKKRYKGRMSSPEEDNDEDTEQEHMILSPPSKHQHLPPTPISLGAERTPTPVEGYQEAHGSSTSPYSVHYPMPPQDIGHQLQTATDYDSRYGFHGSPPSEAYIDHDMEHSLAFPNEKFSNGSYVGDFGLI